MPVIRQLPPSVINKIAAGEVIERPASVVKELVENALDAGATRIDVSLAQGGVDLVRVVDDGAGIAAEELPLAVASHATSKLETADDLFRVRTLGFRGEALASIAEVSRFSLRSRRPDQDAGAELEVVAGAASAVVPCGAAPGTTVEVRNLFFNTPVRRKFLRSTQTEMGHVTEAFTRLALAHPQVHFGLRHNDRAVYDLPPCNEWRERITHFFGADLCDHLIWVESTDPPIRLAGFVAHPSQSRGNARTQYLFLNGRHIRDRALQHALGEAYRGLLLTGRYPISFLCFDMPAEMVDVNVHPTKLEVRFQDGGRLYNQLLSTIRTKFLSTDLTHALVAGRTEAPEGHSTGAAWPPPASPGWGDAPRDTAELRQELVDWAKGQLAQHVGERAAAGPPSTAAGAGDAAAARSGGLELVRLDHRWEAVGVDEPEEPAAGALSAGGMSVELRSGAALAAGSAWHGTHPASSPPVGGNEWGALRGPPAATRALQIHNRYLITESDEGVLVIDQHALHERILYEQLRQKVLDGALEVQPLLVPEPVDLSPAERAAALEHQELLERLGIRVEPFGGDTLLVSSYPAMLSGSPPGEMLRDVIEQLLRDGRPPDRRDLVDELLHMISCKAAIKAGDRLSTEEIQALLEQRHLAQDTHHCPHGRPTALVFTREELDKQFLRT